jgi:hypothetical protein
MTAYGSQIGYISEQQKQLFFFKKKNFKFFLENE